MSSNRTREGRLYDQLVDVMLEATKPDDDGKVPVLEAASMNAVRQFLKDQNVGADPAEHSGLKELNRRVNGEPSRKAPFPEPSEEDL